MGLYSGQSDWGFVFIRLLERLGLASNIITPERLPPHAELYALGLESYVARFHGHQNIGA